MQKYENLEMGQNKEVMLVHGRINYNGEINVQISPQFRMSL